MRDLTQATEGILGLGWRVFQGALLGKTEAAHVSTLLRMMDPPYHTRILDMGCGVGEVAALMQRERPDLDFLLINQDAHQLSLAPVHLPQLQCDYHAVPLVDGCADGAMFCYSLCHANVPEALAEAARLVRPDGFLFVYDYERMSGNNAMMETLLDAHALPRKLMEVLTEEAGWRIQWWRRPHADDARFRSIWEGDVSYESVFDPLVVCAWKAIRR